MKLMFDYIKKGDKFIYRAGHLVYWECVSDEYQYGNGKRKDIIEYKICFQDFCNPKFTIKKTYISNHKLKTEKYGIGSSGRWEKNKRRFFNILFDYENAGYGVF